MHRPLCLAMKFLFSCGLLVAAFATSAVQAGDVRVGTSAVNLQSDDSMVIAGGIGPGKATGQEGELRSVAVVVEKPGTGKIAIVACDVLFVERDFVDQAVAEIEKLTGIPAGNVLVNATHTHHAPSVTRADGLRAREEVCRWAAKGDRAIGRRGQRATAAGRCADALQAR